MAEQIAALPHEAAPRAIGEQAEVADAHEAARHDVEEKSSEECVDVEGHHLRRGGLAINGHADRISYDLDQCGEWQQLRCALAGRPDTPLGP